MHVTGGFTRPMFVIMCSNVYCTRPEPMTSESLIFGPFHILSAQLLRELFRFGFVFLNNEAGDVFLSSWEA